MLESVLCLPDDEVRRFGPPLPSGTLTQQSRHTSSNCEACRTKSNNHNTTLSDHMNLAGKITSCARESIQTKSHPKTGNDIKRGNLLHK